MLSAWSSLKRKVTGAGLQAEQDPRPEKRARVEEAKKATKAADDDSEDSESPKEEGTEESDSESSDDEMESQHSGAVAEPHSGVKAARGEGKTKRTAELQTAEVYSSSSEEEKEEDDGSESESSEDDGTESNAPSARNGTGIHLEAKPAKARQREETASSDEEEESDSEAESSEDEGITTQLRSSSSAPASTNVTHSRSAKKLAAAKEQAQGETASSDEGKDSDSESSEDEEITTQLPSSDNVPASTNGIHSRSVTKLTTAKGRAQEDSARSDEEEDSSSESESSEDENNTTQLPSSSNAPASTNGTHPRWTLKLATVKAHAQEESASSDGPDDDSSESDEEEGTVNTPVVAQDDSSDDSESGASSQEEDSGDEPEASHAKEDGGPPAKLAAAATSTRSFQASTSHVTRPKQGPQPVAKRKSSAQKSANSKPTNTKPANSEPTNSKPANTKPANTKPSSSQNSTPESTHAWTLANKWLSSAQLNKMAATEGLVWKKGKFTATEDKAIMDAIQSYQTDRELSETELHSLIFPAPGQRTSDFWTYVTTSVPNRPLTAVYRYVRRHHHPHYPEQRSWTSEEDHTLKSAVTNFGSSKWTKVSELVGRTPQACRDRWRNNLKTRGERAEGRWSQTEEEKLVDIVQPLENKHGAKGISWEQVSAKMGTRSHTQCRVKWEDSLRVKSKQGGARWKSEHARILVDKIDKLDVKDDSEIDWNGLTDGELSFWSAHVLQVRWSRLKKAVIEENAGKAMGQKKLVAAVKTKLAEPGRRKRR